MRKITIIILLTFSILSCKKEHLNPVNPNPPVVSNPPVTDSAAVTVTVDQSQPGYPISPTFEGLSYETAILTENPEVLNVDNKVLIQLIKNLGPGLLRIGGDTSDEIAWAGTSGTTATANDLLTTADIDRLSAFANVTGWQVLFGLNLGDNNVASAANEAQYVYNSLGNNLYALQAGNEPDIYSMFGIRTPDYTYNNYQADWLSYFNTIKSQLPGASFAGPDVAYNTSYITSFAGNENKKVKMIDAHYYLTGPASSSYITYQTLLDFNYGLPNYLQILNNESSKYQLPYRITESNNVYGGGKPGVSDVFASALWALDLMWTVAENNGQGINFHGGSGLFYSPLTVKNGIVTAMPEYYAMLAFKYGSTGGKIIPATINTQYNCNAYASANTDNTSSVTLINKETAVNISFTIQLSKTASVIQVARLIAPSVTSGAGVTFAGNTVNTDGTFKPGITAQSAINKKSFSINVPAGSAAVVTIQ